MKISIGILYRNYMTLLLKLIHFEQKNKIFLLNHPINFTGYFFSDSSLVQIALDFIGMSYNECYMNVNWTNRVKTMSNFFHYVC